MGSLWLTQSGSLRRSCAIAAFLSCALTASVQAQDIEVTPAHVSVVDGRVSLLRDGQLEQLGTGMPFVPGDQLRTEAGRAEILFPDGSALDVDEFTSVDMLSPTLVRVTAGRVLLVVFGAANPSAAVRYQIDTPSASAATDGPGEYRVAIFDGAQTELAVTRGWAALSTEAGTTPVRAGERTIAAAGRPPSVPQLFNSARFDAFDRWVAAQRGDRAGLAASSQYLPNDLRVYSGDFDRSGSWGYEASYGNVWYPTVPVGWRPYYNGYWSSVPVVRMDLDWIRSVGMADSPLRTMGLPRKPLVLGSRSALGTGVGVVGRRAGLCQLVPARLQQPTGVCPVCELWKCLGGMDRRSTGALCTCSRRAVGGDTRSSWRRAIREISNASGSSAADDVRSAAASRDERIARRRGRATRICESSAGTTARGDSAAQSAVGSRNVNGWSSIGCGAIAISDSKSPACRSSVVPGTRNKGRMGHPQTTGCSRLALTSRRLDDGGSATAG